MEIPQQKPPLKGGGETMSGRVGNVACKRLESVMEPVLDQSCFSFGVRKNSSMSAHCLQPKKFFVRKKYLHKKSSGRSQH